MSFRYQVSEQQLERALRTIPLGAQTFSKSLTQYPHGVSPYFANSGRGSKLYDVDGNEYIDYVNGLAAVTIGYADPDINAAVMAQLQQGTVFSLSHPLEAEVAELVCAMVPSAEMVRFGKNGSDATSGAIRLARAVTGRDLVLMCGYHGWQDWSIGTTTRNKGIPKPVRDLSLTFPYDDLKALRRLLDERDGEVAAIILEPMNVRFPSPGYLEGVRSLATAHGALLIFDETITGFRFAWGGAQELFGIMPDLTTLGKGIANGFPLSAVCGRRDLMKGMEEIFFSFTMGGETLSLAAAKAVLCKLRDEPVIETLASRGEALAVGTAALIAKHGLGDAIELSGHPSWSIFTFKDTGDVTLWELKTLWMQELLARGILSLGTHNISYAHTEADVAQTLDVYDEVFSILADAVLHRGLRQHLQCATLKPLFAVR